MFILILTTSFPVNSQTNVNHGIVPVSSRLIGGHGSDYLTTSSIDGNNNTIVSGYFSYPIFNVPGTGPTSFYQGPFYDINREEFVEYPVVGEGNSVHYSGQAEFPLTKLDDTGEVVYSKYYGGSGSDIATDIEILEDNSILLVGYTTSNQFEGNNITNFQNNGYTDGFILHVDENGNTIDFRTIGGNSFDNIEEIEIMSDGSIIVAGTTLSLDFPLIDSYQNVTPSEEGYSDIFVAKYNSTYNLEFSTVIGGNQSEGVRSLLIDENNNIYVGGYSLSLDFPTLNTPYDNNFGLTDGILFKLNQNGTLQKSTYFGGRLMDTVDDMNFLSNGNIVVIGTTRSDDFPVSQAASGVDREFNTDEVSGPISDGFFSIFDANLNQQTAGYLGGSSSETLGAVVGDDKGNFYITGSTNSPDYPIHGPFERPPPFNNELLDVAEDGVAQQDLIMTKITGEGKIAYSIFFGGFNADRGKDIQYERINGQDTVTIVGYTLSGSFPVTQAALGGGALDNGFMLTLEIPEGIFGSVPYPGRDNTARNILISSIIGIIVLTISFLYYRRRKKSKVISKEHNEYREKYDLIKEAMRQD